MVALSFGLFGRGGGASLFSSEGRSEHVVPNVVQTTQFIARITLVIVSVATVIITALCLFMGMEHPRLPERAVGVYLRVRDRRFHAHAAFHHVLPFLPP